MRFSVTCILSLFLLGTVIASPVIAQNPPPSRPSTGMVKLADILPEVRWNVEERGPLLIVAPDKLVRRLSGRRIEEGKIIRDPVVEPPQRGPDGYRLVSWEAYYDHHVTPCGTLTVFAPNKMSVMNSRLPKPDIFSEMRPAEKWKLLQASLTPAQWKKLCRNQGIGAGDLNKDQQQLFFSVLPNPLKIGILDEKNRRSGESVAVGNSARSQVRIALQRRIHFQVMTGPDSGAILAPGTENRFFMDTYDLSRNVPPGYDDAIEAYGAVLFERVRAHQKPGDLDFSWEGLNPPVSLSGAETVQNLITRIREATRLELYCDRRYGDLTVHIRGESARAGDILRALCLGVSGAIRKVGSAYILTEDRLGFGTRQVMLSQWTNAAARQAGHLALEASNQLLKAPAEMIPWASDDPMRPDKKLLQRVNDFRERYQNLTDSERRRKENRELTVPVAELPPAYRESFQRQIAAIEENNRQIPAGILELHPELAKNQVQIAKDSVVISERAGTVLLVPGYGRVDPQNALGDGPSAEHYIPGYGAILGSGYITWDRPRVKGAPPLQSFQYPEVIALPEQQGSRILVVAVEDTDEAKKAIPEAKRLGFDMLWIEVKPDQKAILEAAVAEGKTQGVAIGAVVRVLRSFRNSNLSPDQNIRGETSLKMADRYTVNPFERENYGGMVTHMADGSQRRVGPANPVHALVRERRVGNWLTPLSAENQEVATANIRAIAQIPGLTGVVLRDIIPPGYRSPGGVYDHYEGSAEYDAFGYTEEMRLTFLRQYSVDPIDLSPNGSEMIPSVNKPFARLSYPLFPNFGLTGKYANSGGRLNGTLTYDLGAKDAPEKWLEYRVAVNQDAIRAMMKHVQATVPDVPLYWMNDRPDTATAQSRWTAVLEKGEPGIAYLTPPPQARQSWPPAEGRERPEIEPRTPAQLARPGAKKIFVTLYYVPRVEDDPVSDFRQQAYETFLGGQKGWDGIVIDLTAVPIREAIHLLIQTPFRYEPPKSTQ